MLRKWLWKLWKSCYDDDDDCYYYNVSMFFIIATDQAENAIHSSVSPSLFLNPDFHPKLRQLVRACLIA